MRTKIKSYKTKVNTNFHNHKITKEGSQYICLSISLLDSIFKTAKNYYPEVFLEGCKYAIKEKKIHSYNTHDVEISSDSYEETLLEEIQMDKNSDYEENSDKDSREEDSSEKKN